MTFGVPPLLAASCDEPACDEWACNALDSVVRFFVLQSPRMIGDVFMRPSGYDLSVIIVNFESGRQLQQCVASLSALGTELNSELIVVDNSPPEARRCLQELAPGGRVRLVEAHRNVGYAAACNLGLQLSSAPYLLFLNPDTRYQHGSVGQLLDWLDKNNSVALLGPRIENSDGTRQFSCRSFPGLSTAFSHAHSLLTRWLPNNPFSQAYLLPNLDGQPTHVDWASGCCLFARRGALTEVDGFDEEYFLYFEDVDLAYRLKGKGWASSYYPHVVFSHEIGASRAVLPDCGSTAKHASAVRYFRKNVVKNSAMAGAFGCGVAVRSGLSNLLNAGRRKLRR